MSHFENLLGLKICLIIAIFKALKNKNA